MPDQQHNDNDLDFTKIAHDARIKAQDSEQGGDLSWRFRAVIILAAIVVAVNAVVGVYNSLALRQEVKCNHELTTALNVVGDQSRNINRRLFESLLTGTDPATGKPVDKAALEKTYVATNKDNDNRRNSLLQTTCQDGSTPSSTPSLGKP